MCDIIVIDMKSYDNVFNHPTQIETVTNLTIQRTTNM